MESSYLTIAFLMMGLGVVLLVAEFFMPTGGFLIVIGVALCAIAVGIVCYYGTRTEAVVATIGLCVGVPASGFAMFQGWKRFAIRSGLDPDAAGGTITAAVPELSEREKLRGRYGKTATPMRPSGAVIIDGKRVDAMSEGMMLDVNVWVRCVDIKGSTVVVRQVDEPQDLKDFSLDDLK